MNVLALFEGIKNFVFDVDGVLTDGTLLVLPDGVMARRMNIKDGYALQLAVKKGYNVIVISGGNSPEVKERLYKLGVNQVYMQVADKKTLLQNLAKEHNFLLQETLFMGDDVPDVAAMQEVKLACCPCDAAIDVQQVAQFISSFKGGEGCVREVIEKVMRLQNTWDVHTLTKAQ